ncbi:hypothetical protein HMPREF9374_1911 [Desmospora sp. 8437]|nr:hypothetical protein HMPREF9374_1911 [Desmospora sp. 8437]
MPLVMGIFRKSILPEESWLIPFSIEKSRMFGQDLIKRPPPAGGSEGGEW